MRIVISIAIMFAIAACGDDSEGNVDGGGEATSQDATTDIPPDAGDTQPPDAAPDAGPPDSGPVEYGVSGCWVTHTSSGETQIDLVEQSDGQVTGTQSYTDDSTGDEYTYTVENGVVDENGLVFTVNWSDFSFTCDYTFTEVSADALSGTADCGDVTQDITADRTCI